MKRLLIVAIPCLCVVVLGFALPARSEPNQQVNEFMRKKLAQSQQVLEGLAVEDFSLIASGAKEMGVISQAASWQVLQTPEYVQHSLEFRRVAEELADAAAKKNLDGATLAYVQLTLECVQCHKYVRSVRMAQVSSPPRR
ncbi:MAG: hypothetical protein K1X74_18815 [Pirellulales bacterium]|nr:hypothetical protein [Pirellulales bacterium]